MQVKAIVLMSNVVDANFSGVSPGVAVSGVLCCRRGPTRLTAGCGCWLQIPEHVRWRRDNARVVTHPGVAEALDYSATTFSGTDTVTPACSRTPTGCVPTVLMCALGNSTVRLSRLGPPAFLMAATTEAWVTEP